ncbi:MAG: right-handed parallel beta-helix repeat-containing protein [Promethearchaeota archaeon]
MRKNGKNSNNRNKGNNGTNVLVGLLVSVWLIGVLIMGSAPLVQTNADEPQNLTISIMPKVAATHDPIFIDDDDPANDWTTCDAVTGSGTEADPYVIRDLVIDAEGTGSGIYIQDSSVYGKIVNCSISNSGDILDAGIRIQYSSLISVENCSTFNSQVGVLLHTSNGNTIMENNFSTDYSGIYLYESSGNLLTGNNCSASYFGISIDNSDGNSLLGNNCSANSQAGIWLSHSNLNILTGNNCTANTFDGIHLDSSDGNTLTGNNCSANNQAGIYLKNVNLDNGIFWNLIDGNPTGIEINSASTTSIIDNWIWDNTNYDIYEISAEANATYSYNFYTAWYGLYDTDRDGLSDGDEFTHYTSPVKVDTDNDNFLDGYEVLYGSDPTNPLDYPTMPAEWYNAFAEIIGENTAMIDVLGTWAAGNTTLLENLIADCASNASLLESVATWLSGNATEIETLLTLLEGNATLLINTIEMLQGNTTLLETVVALAEQNTEYLSNLNSTISGNITQIQAVLEQLGINIGDSDYDGLDDLEELTYGTSITCSDTDCDNLNDAFEIKYGTNPLNDDSDGDTWLDGVEVAAGTDPKNATDYPGASLPTNDGDTPTNDDDTPTDDDTSGSTTWLTYAGIAGGVALVGVFALLIIKNQKK